MGGLWLAGCATPTADRQPPTGTTTAGNRPLTATATDERRPATVTPTDDRRPTTGAPTGFVSPSPTPAQFAIRNSQYSLSVFLDNPSHRLTVTETITYVNTTGVELASLPLVIEPNRREGIFTLYSLAWANSDLPVYTLDGATLTLALPLPLAPLEHVTLHIGYELTLPLVNAPLGYTGRQSNFGDWYPFVPAYRGGWLIYSPTGVGEHLAYDTAAYTVEIRVSDPAVIIAASGGTPVMGGNRYRLEAARAFAWSASPEYVVSRTVEGSAILESYTLPEHTAAGEVVLQETAKAVQLYAELFGDYPHAGLAVVEADFFDGMEYDGLYFLGHEYYAAYAGSPQGWLTVIAVHETAHQWWYALVGNDPAREPWLDEALCTFTERLFFERYYPEDVDWWQEFRLERYAPSGWVNSTTSEHSAFRPYVNAVYLRGALFLQALRQRVGDEAFFSFLRAYAAEYRGRLATGEDFWGLLERYSSEAMDDLRTEFFRQGFYP